MVKLHRVPSRPTDVDLRTFVDAAVRERDKRHHYFWKDEQKNSEFMLAVKYLPSAEGAMEWRMYLGSGTDAREIWFHITPDLAMIYSMIAKAVGVDLEEAVKEDARITQKSLKAAKPHKIAEPLNTTTFGSIDPVTEEELTRFRSRAREEALSGDLKLVHITNLLQSIAMGNMSGRLNVRKRHSSVEIYVENGAPVHAIGTMGDGVDCLLQAIGWQEGNFHFEPNLKTDCRTINQSLSWIIMQGVKLQDNTDYLKTIGLSGDSVLVRTRPETTEHEFELIMARGEPLDMDLLKRHYLAVDDRRSLKDINDLFNLPRSQWVPVIANLIKCELVSIKKVVRGGKIVVEPKHIDRNLIDATVGHLLRQDTGFFTYSAFLYMLGHDAEVRAGSDRSLSLMVFEVRQMPPSTSLVGPTHLSPPAMQELARRINELKRPSDTLAHYEGHDFAIIMPDAKPAAALVLAERIMQSMMTSSIVKGLEPNWLQMSFGVAAIPDDVDNVASLLSAAEMAKNNAKANGKPIVLLRDLDA